MERSDAILERLTTLHPKEIDLSLERVERLMADLGHPERRLAPVIIVAGTNGKGSTTAFMRAMLEAAGKRVHVYTSPHLVRFHERIRLGDGERSHFVDEDELVEAPGAGREDQRRPADHTVRDHQPLPLSISSRGTRPTSCCWKSGSAGGSTLPTSCSRRLPR